MIVEIILFLVTTVIAYFVYTQRKNEQFFKERGVNVVPGWPLFGNTMKSNFVKQHVVYDINDVYSAFPTDRYVGYIEGTLPILLIKDPTLIKLITVKDFDHFVDHRQFIPDQIFSDSLLMMKGDRWRDMRATLSPAFTGSKMKNMVPFITEISHNYVEHMKENEGQDIDLADLIRRYTNDVIASTGFGLQVNSLKDPTNDFYKAGQELMTFTPWQRVQFFLMLIFPFLTRFMDVFPKKTTDFFTEIVKSTMRIREKNSIERPDMIHLLMEASKGTLKGITHEKHDNVGFAATEEANINNKSEARQWRLDELVAQAFIFFFAAFESSASILVMALHELALNKDVQDKLYQEVKTYQDQHGKLMYEGVQELKYLDCVLNETLRKWTPGVVMDRVCQKPYTLPPARDGAPPYTIEPGHVVYNMMTSLHLDERYYPEPTKFDPDRFSDGNKQNIQPFTFVPFGVGPRNCIGSRFAILELKILLHMVVVNLEILKTEKTTDPIRLKPNDFNIRSDGGSWVKFKIRN